MDVYFTLLYFTLNVGPACQLLCCVRMISSQTWHSNISKHFQNLLCSLRNNEPCNSLFIRIFVFGMDLGSSS